MANSAKDTLGGFVITACGVIDAETFAFSAAADEKVSPWKEVFEAGTPPPSCIMSHNVTTGLWRRNGPTPIMVDRLLAVMRLPRRRLISEVDSSSDLP